MMFQVVMALRDTTANGQEKVSGTLIASTVTYTYDSTNRLTQITQGTSTVTFAYDVAGRRTSLTLPNGMVVEYGYDAASRLTGLTYRQGVTVIGDLTYTYDKAGRRIATGGSFSRTGVPQAVSTATYDAANQQLTLGDKSLTFDQNGNLATLTDPSGTTTYTWNARDQLVALSGPGLSASFQYDALGRRQQKTVNGTTTAFLYDGLNPVQELSGGTPTANLLTGLGVDEYLSRTDAAGTQSFLPDALGSALALTDSAGTVQTEYTYEPFGQTTVSGASSTNPFQYTGRENDGTGLYYYRARYYHPTLQRFISEDPIGFAGGINLYAYVENSPLNETDPLGLFTEVIVWQPVGEGRSSFGHISVNINGGTFSFNEQGMYTPTTSEYLQQNGFRNGIGMELNLTPDQEHVLEQFLINYDQEYNHLVNNCTDPIQEGLRSLGIDLGLNFTPSSLGLALRNARLVSGVRFYPKT